VIVILAVARLSAADLRHTRWISWINCLLAIWIFASPWVFQYAANTDRLVNSLCIGVILFLAAMISALSAPKLPARS
jgi:hypothetical protein